MVKIVGDEVVTVTRFREGETEDCSKLPPAPAVCNLSREEEEGQQSGVFVLYFTPHLHMTKLGA